MYKTYNAPPNMNLSGGRSNLNICSGSGVVWLFRCFSPTPAFRQSTDWRPAVKCRARCGHRRDQREWEPEVL